VKRLRRVVLTAPIQVPSSALSSPKGASQLLEMLSTTASVPASEPVELQLAAGEEQVILLDEPSEKDLSEVLAQLGLWLPASTGHLGT